jgi:hypothetical protein
MRSARLSCAATVSGVQPTKVTYSVAANCSFRSAASCATSSVFFESITHDTLECTLCSSCHGRGYTRVNRRQRSSKPTAEARAEV